MNIGYNNKERHMKFYDTQSVIEQMTPMDDSFFNILVEDKEVCEELLRIILDKPDLVVIQAVPQRNMRNIFGGSVIDTMISSKGTHFKDLPDVYIIYISGFDIFKKLGQSSGRTVYHIIRVIEETGQQVFNGYHEIYVNTETHDGSCIADLMQLFTSSHVHEDQRFPRFCASVKYFKEGEGQKRMSGVYKSHVDEYLKECVDKYVKEHTDEFLEKYAKEHVHEYAEEYTAKQSKEFAIKLFKKKMSYEDIKDVTNLPDEILKELQESIK